MIELYVSTKTPGIEKHHVAQWLLDNGVENIQVSDNVSTHHGRLEKGFHIRLFDITDADFRVRVWDILQPRLALTCAYVHFIGRYAGCTANWPGVFRESLCPKDPRFETDV